MCSKSYSVCVTVGSARTPHREPLCCRVDPCYLSDPSLWHRAFCSFCCDQLCTSSSPGAVMLTIGIRHHFTACLHHQECAKCCGAVRQTQSLLEVLHHMYPLYTQSTKLCCLAGPSLCNITMPDVLQSGSSLLLCHSWCERQQRTGDAQSAQSMSSHSVRQPQHLPSFERRELHGIVFSHHKRQVERHASWSVHSSCTNTCSKPDSED